MSKIVELVSKNFKKINPESIDDYIEVGGYKALEKVFNMNIQDVFDELKKSGLKGRGGASYPTGKKWQEAAAVEGDTKIVICNADEGEPCTFKDRYLLQYDPFKIIEGMTIAAYVIGAKEGYIYIREEYSILQERMRKVIKAANERGYLGKNILESGLDSILKLLVVQEHMFVEKIPHL